MTSLRVRTHRDHRRPVERGRSEESGALPKRLWPATSFRKLGMALGVATLTVWSLAAPVADAQSPPDTLVVEGHVTNGTAGAPVPTGLAVVLHRHTDAGDSDLETTTDADGRFRFHDVAYNPEALYGVSVRHKEALYGRDLDMSAGSPSPVSITIYEAVDTESSLSVSSASVLVADADPVSQTLWALEIVKVYNGTDTTYVPGTGPMSLLRFGLPPGARDLSVDTRLLGADVIQVNLGFALTAAVPPGEHEVMYAYRFPYTAASTLFVRSFRYGAGSLRVLAPYEVAQLSSQQLLGPEPVTVGGRTYQLLTASDIQRGSRISFELQGLPQASLGERLGARVRAVRLEYVAPLALGLLMLSLVGLTLLRRAASGRAHSAGATGGSLLEAEHNRLIEQIAGLEQRFEEGSLTEAQYHRQRSTLATRLAGLSRQRD